jgi:hypothetical protein
VNAIDFVAPINVCIYLNKSYGAVTIECTEHRYGDTMVTANDNREGFPAQNSLHDCFCDPIVPLDIGRITWHVSTVEDPNVLPTEQRSSQIKIPLVQTNA